MSEKKKEDLNENLDEDVEKELDALWNNWASRRKCESTYVPDYVRKNNKRKNN